MRGTLHVLFNNAERKLIEEIIKIGRDMVPVSNQAMGYGPTSRAVSELKGDLFARVPFIGGAQPLMRMLREFAENRRLTDVMSPPEAALKEGR